MGRLVVLRRGGVPGKALLPMMVGFGCSVPAIYATRALDTHRDRLRRPGR